MTFSRMLSVLLPLKVTGNLEEEEIRMKKPALLAATLLAFVASA